MVVLCDMCIVGVGVLCFVCVVLCCVSGCILFCVCYVYVCYESVLSILMLRVV